MATRRTNIEKMSFEVLLSELEKTVQCLESGDESLDKSIEIFAKGMQLAKAAEAKLHIAEQQIELLTKDAQGNVQLEIFEEQKED